MLDLIKNIYLSSVVSYEFSSLTQTYRRTIINISDVYCILKRVGFTISEVEALCLFQQLFTLLLNICQSQDCAPTLLYKAIISPGSSNCVYSPYTAMKHHHTKSFTATLNARGKFRNLSFGLQRSAYELLISSKNCVFLKTVTELYLVYA